MRDELLFYYERELAALRRTGSEFAKRYPKVASRLMLEPTKCEDPHVERLLEGFAFLAARVHLKLDDDLPELSESLLEVVYPQHVRPVPSMSLVEFQLDPDQAKLPRGLPLPRGTTLFSRAVGGIPCKFQNCYHTTLWPVTVGNARWMAPFELSPPIRADDAVGALRLELHCSKDVRFADLTLETLRFHLSAEANLASTLYELLLNNCVQILLRDPTPGTRRETIRLPASALQPVGFKADEGMLPLSPRIPVGHRLLKEYFTFPEKFFFLDLSGFDRLRLEGFDSRAEVIFLISSFEMPERRSMLESGVSATTIRTNCAPIVNLYPQTSEPILLTHQRQEYPIIPDARRQASTGVYSIEDVVAVTPGAEGSIRFEPFYSLRHGREIGSGVFWHARRRPTNWRMDEGSDVYLSFLDLKGRTAQPAATAVTARLLCYNGDLPSRLPFGNPAGDFEIPGGGPIPRIVALLKPTEVVQPALGKAQLWRLISLLSLNYTSLVSGGPDAIRELLRLHNAADSTAGEKQIQGVLDVRGSPVYSRIDSEYGLTFARGQRVEMDFDEERFVGGGVYLLATVLHYYLGLAVSLNSFCVLAARTRQRRRMLAEFPPRSGWKTLL